MKSTIVYVILFLSFFLYKPIMAQFTQGKESLIAPSPTVAAIAKFGQIPVGYNTGVPNISIPLYTLKCGNLALPISMDYHAGGIRVNDVASWVGLGWSLNVGGAINIAVQGGKDSYTVPTIIPIDDLESSEPYTTEVLQSFQTGPDTEPDIYNYQVGSYTGQFMIDLRDGTLKAYNVNGLKDITFDITRLGPSMDITAKDQLGTKYSFDNVQEETSNTIQYYKYSFNTNSFTTYPDGQVYGSTIITAVPLSKMVNANKTDSIVFNYNRMYEDYYSQMNGSLCWGMSSSRTGWTEYINPFPNYSKSPYYPNNYSRVKKQSITRKVSTIIGSNGTKIVLTASTNRNDLNLNLSAPPESEKSKSLDKIEIFDVNNNLVKRWEFVYDYFVSYITNPDDNATNYRLKLVGLKEYGSTSEPPQTYTFNYYGDVAGEPQLPYRNSYSGQDYWGYCNKLVAAADATNFKKAFPNIDNFNFTQYYRLNAQSTSATQLVSYTEGESKEPNADFLSACSLKKITYPTGGSTTFEYESNISSFMYADPNWTNRMGGGQRIKKITSDPLIGIPVVKEYLYTDGDGNSTGEITNVPRPAREKVWQITGQDAAGYWDDWGVNYYHVRNHSSSFDQSYLELKSDCSSPLYTSIGSVLTYSTVTETGSEGKTIYNFFKREHEEFSNMLGYDFVPFGYEGFSLRMDNLEGVCCQLTSRYDERQTEDRGYWGTYYKHGTLQRKEVYNKNNQLVFEESYEYQDLNQKKITGVRVYQNPDISSGKGIFPGSAGKVIDLSPTYFYNTYATLVGQCQLTGKSTTQYDVNGGNPITTKEEYTYNDDNLLVQTKSTNSLHEVITTTNRYPADINTGIYNVMKQRNMLNYPIEIIKKKNNMLIGSVLNTYQQVNGVSNFTMFLPAKVYQSKLTSPATSFTPFNGTVLDPSYQSSPDVEYLSHDDKGNTCEIKGRNGITTSYLWGYNKTYPVAEIVGKSYNEAISQSGISLSILNNITNNDAVIRQELNKLRSLSNCLVTTYTYKLLVGMTSATDANGRTTYYEYDGFGRLAYIRDKDNNILKKFCYNYAGQTESCPLSGNVAQSGTFIKNGCTAGNAGTPVTYTVPANTYFGSNADVLAQNDVNANGQAYADQHGTCVIARYNVAKSGAFTKNNCTLGGTPSSVTYTVAAGTYAAYSQQAADQLAQNAIDANGQTYANNNGFCTWYNELTLLPFQKNNCTGGATGSIVDYTVPAGTYSSTFSPYDANNKALNDVNLNGQNYANTHGECRWYNGMMALNVDKNDCPGGSTGTMVHFEVPPNKYSSTISQDDANAQASAELYGDAQAYANANGSCEVNTINVLYTNSDWHDVDVWFYSTTSDDVFYFNIPPYRSDVPLAIPPGTYDIVFWPNDSGRSSHFFTAACGYWTSGYNGVTIYGVPFGTDQYGYCNTISSD